MYKANIEYAVGTRLERSYQKSKEIGYIDTPETIEEEWTESDERELDIELRKFTVGKIISKNYFTFVIFVAFMNWFFFGLSGQF